MITLKLSDTPSEMLEQALRDLEIAEQSENYYIDMSMWHEPVGPNMCAVCLAGAVLAQNGASKDQTYDDLMLNTADNNKLTALNMFRTGQISRGLEELGISKRLPKMYVTRYETDVVAFKRDMQAVIARLKEAGL